jgi:hypothetical protein
MADSESNPPSRRALADRDIATTSLWDRRSVLRAGTGVVALRAVGAGGAPFVVSDSDPGDPVGRGRAAATGRTDQDVGQLGDPAGRGRGALTDGDAAPAADPPGLGRGPRRNQQRPPTTFDQDQGKQGDVAAPTPRGAISDLDEGAISDRVGEGRGPPRGSVSDRDQAPADPLGQGRGARSKPTP